MPSGVAQWSQLAKEENPLRVMDGSGQSVSLVVVTKKILVDKGYMPVPDRHGVRVSTLNPEGRVSSPKEGNNLSDSGARLNNELDLGNLNLLPIGSNQNVQFSEGDIISHTPSTNGLLVPLWQDLPLAS